MPGGTSRPYGGWFDEVVDGLESALAETGRRRPRSRRSSSTAARSPSSSAATTCWPWPQLLRDDAQLRFEFCSGVSGRALPRRRGPRAARGLPPALDDPQPPDPARGHLPRRRPARPVDRRGLPDQRLARARDLRLLRDHLRRPPGADPDRDARRLAGPPAAQGLPARRHPRRVQGRHHPAAGRAEVLH